MTVIYYFETNMICIVLLLLLLRRTKMNYNQISTNNLVFTRIIVLSVILCAADMVSGICHGRFFTGSRAIIEISNIIFFEALVLISYMWFVYVSYKLNIPNAYDKKRTFLWAIPLLIFTVLAVTNPISDFLFRIDGNNNYVRNYGVYLHWIVMWFYLIVAAIRTALAIAGEKNEYHRSEYYPLLSFIIAPIITGVIQMFFYGISAIQVGVTVSIVMIFISDQNNQVLSDTLTGLNNRRGLNNYFDDYAAKHADKTVFIMIIDIDNFKRINDKFGHITGDRALKDAALALRTVCASVTDRLFLCRYGGDEFLVAGRFSGEDAIEQLKENFIGELEKINKTNANPYKLSASIGSASGTCANNEDITALTRLADEKMYEEKKNKKVARIA